MTFIFYILFCVLVTAVMCGYIAVWNRCDFEDAFVIWLPCMLASLLIFCVMFLCFDNEPRAIEVYQGKTVLQRTYVDGVLTDSTVVYKNVSYE